MTRSAILLFVVMIGVSSAQARQPEVTVTAGDAPLLTLEEVRLLVLEQNPTLAIARIETEIARRDATPGAVGLLPAATLSATQRRVPTPDGVDDFRNESLDLTAGVGMRLFEGGARFARLDRLRSLAEATELDAQALTQELLAQAQIIYFDITAQQERIVVLQEAVDLSQERLRIATGRRDVGAASALEVNLAEVDLNADRAALLRQEAALAQTKTRLNQILDRPPTTPFRAEARIVVDETLALDDLRRETLDRSPTLLAQQVSLEAASLQETAIQREFWPSLDLNVNYAFSELTDPLLPPTQVGGLSYGLTATFNLFDGFDRSRRLQTARLRSQQQELATDRTRTALLADLESTFALYERSLVLVQLGEANVEAARQNAMVALERFRLGASTSLELREVQRALIDAESQLVAARFEAKAAEVDLRGLAALLGG